MTESQSGHPKLPFDLTAASNIAAASDKAPGAFGDEDPELVAVQERLLELDPSGGRFARVLRSTIDQLLDGENTGRYDWRDLHKTEKTHAGTLVEINLLREFGFDSGHDMDYLISGVEVDCKFSQKLYKWMIPPEALDEICLVVWADDLKTQWSAGLFRANQQKLTTSGNKTRRGNRDGKFQLTKSHHSLVCWLWDHEPLPKNLLLHLDPATRDAIFTAGDSSRSPGQARVTELFWRVQQQKINRTAVRTLAQQKDYMKRVRYDGGARDRLRPRGVLIFGDYRSHQDAAAELGIPVPQEGEFVSVRVVKAKPQHAGQPRTCLDGEDWVVAEPTETEEVAPLVPKTKKGSAE